METATTSQADLRRRIGRAWRQLRRGAGAVGVREYFYGGPDALDMALADALSEIYLAGPLRMGDLAEALQITPASTTRAVNCLVEKGYVGRVKNLDDQRSIKVSVTPTGEARMENIHNKIGLGLNEILSEFSEQEQNQFAHSLERFVEAMDNFVEDQATPTMGIANTDTMADASGFHTDLDE